MFWAKDNRLALLNEVLSLNAQEFQLVNAIVDEDRHPQ